MDLLSIFLIAVGLAMDCFVVSVSEGIRHNSWNWKIILMAVLFGLFQGGMPLISYFLGSFFADFISRYAPWIALAILSYIGGKMLVSANKSKEENTESINSDAPLTLPRIILLAVATSIDALSTGLLFVPYPQQVWIGVGTIAFISFAFTFLGFSIGKHMGRKITISPDWFAGILLIIIGLKIFISSFL